jgi:hypothetical protein
MGKNLWAATSFGFAAHERQAFNPHFCASEKAPFAGKSDVTADIHRCVCMTVLQPVYYHLLGHSLLSLQTLGQKSCETKDAHVQKGSSYLIFSR